LISSYSWFENTITPPLGCRGLYIGKYPPPPGGKYQLMSFGGKKYEKVNRKRGENIKKRKKGEIK
jgi:hypothetical protein